MRMKMPKLGMLILAGCVALTTFAAPAVARKDKPAVDTVCDPLTQSIRRNTSAAGLLIGGFDGDGDAAIDKGELKAGTERMFRVADSERNRSEERRVGTEGVSTSRSRGRADK